MYIYVVSYRKTQLFDSNLIEVLPQQQQLLFSHMASLVYIFKLNLDKKLSTDTTD